VTYDETIQYLRSLQMFGLRLGLEETRALAQQCGNPQDQLRFIHVAGTNGKGSVCAMLEAMYRHAGRRVGLYTSPHLVAFGERIQINRELMPEAELIRWTARIRETLAGSGRTPTFFEFVTVMALGYFAEQRCDLVIWETGLGGRLDATNIVTPLASVITNIELDHQPWLGSTHDAIAAEKAGIIKPGVPVVTAAEPGRGLETIVAAAQSRGCPLTIIATKARRAAHTSFAGRTIPEEDTWSHAAGASAGPWPQLALAGRHQITNAAVALATVHVLANAWPVSPEAMRTGLETAHWPGRLQRLRRAVERDESRAGDETGERAGDESQVVWLDGAHNPASALALQQALQELEPNSRFTLILGVLADKEWEPIVSILAPMAGRGRIMTVPVSSHRTLPAAELAEACRRANLQAEVMEHESLAAALRETAHDPSAQVVITGSLYLVGEALEQLATTSSLRGERGLNEWGKGPGR
jgi:dihydrofolate synthase/folylpolyglutamate synthase